MRYRIVIAIWLVLILWFVLGMPGAWANDWNKSDSARELAFSALLIADWSQTLQIADDCDTYIETNPILGSCPSRSKVNTYMAVSLLGHAGISYLLPRKYRSTWQNVTLIIQSSYVYNNYQIGLKIKF